jgi:aldose 1-epimerase
LSSADGFQTVAISSPELHATFVPGAGMVCCSLRHEGAELLAQRSGVRAYAERGSTMGIPLLYPWANRLAGFDYGGGAGLAPVELSRASPLLKLDEHGLPIHGAIAGALPWELLDEGNGKGNGGSQGRGEDGATDGLHARLRWQRPEELAIFPFAHTLTLHSSIDGAKLTIETSVEANADMRVPVSFGFHPYLSLPGGKRENWQIELPVSRRLLLDERMIPTGASEPFEQRRFALAQSSWDDAFAGLLEPPLFAVSGGARRIELELLAGYSHAQLYAPASEDFVCFEPMTAPTNALVSLEQLPVLEPGETFRAAFSIAVTTPR